MFADDLIACLNEYYRHHTPVEKSKAVQDIARELQLRPEGKLYLHPGNSYAVRFSYSSKGTFSNTVLALSKLVKYDHMPVIVCLLKPDSWELMLANTTFLHKISHSSHALSVTNIKGSFLGSDIMRVYEGEERLDNIPEHFERLFAIHRQHELEDNIERLVEATAHISAAKGKFPVDAAARARIHDSIRYSFKEWPSIRRLKPHLDRHVEQNRDRILEAARLDKSNVNLRGNRIEQLITFAGNRHRLGDEEMHLPDGGRVTIDIKTSIAGQSSYPKLYNIDKQLEALSGGKTACLLYFVHLDLEENRVSTYLVNCFDEAVIENTRVQFHWAGRNSRGVTQLDMNIRDSFRGEWRDRHDLPRALQFIDALIDENWNR